LVTEDTNGIQVTAISTPLGDAMSHGPNIPGHPHLWYWASFLRCRGSFFFLLSKVHTTGGNFSSVVPISLFLFLLSFHLILFRVALLPLHAGLQWLFFFPWRWLPPRL
jgi:hypothetical protein